MLWHGLLTVPLPGKRETFGPAVARSGDRATTGGKRPATAVAGATAHARACYGIATGNSSTTDAMTIGLATCEDGRVRPVRTSKLLMLWPTSTSDATP